MCDNFVSCYAILLILVRNIQVSLDIPPSLTRQTWKTY